MALMGTVTLSQLITWGSWMKKDIITDIPDTNVVNTSFNKIKTQMTNMSKTIAKYLIAMTINYGEESYYDNSYSLDTNIKFEDDKINKIVVTSDRKLFISVYGEAIYRFLHEFDLDFQIKIMNKVEQMVSNMEQKNRTNFKF